MRSFKSFIKESIIDPERKTYAKGVFDSSDTNNPKLKKKVIDHINSELKNFGSVSDIIEIHLIGSILTKRYRDNADIDLNVLFKDTGKDLRKIAMKINGKILPGTKHPVNFYPLTDKNKFDKADELADAVYDVGANKFIRKPKQQKFDPKKYMKQFEEVVSNIDLLKAELDRDLVDYKELKSLDSSDVKNLVSLIENKIKEIENDSKDLVDIYDDIKKKRKKVFETDLTSKEIREYGSKNALPDNVIYKMLEKFCYISFLKKVKEVMKDGKITEPEIKELEKADKKCDEVLNLKTAKIEDVIRDFENSDAPQFKGKTKEERRKMAIAAVASARKKI